MKTPQLGFGTAPLLGRVSRRAGISALQEAFKAGVRHFDTARSYGWGEAEGVLGEFLSKFPREELRIVSKCGIVPVRRTPLLQFVKSSARLVLSAVPALRKRINRIASSSTFAPQHSVDVDVLKLSFAKSLAELRTPYLDVLLLHNYSPAMAGLDEVVTWFRELKDQGRILRYGFSVEGNLIEALSDLSSRRLLDEAVVQAPMSEELLNLPADWKDVSFVVHSPFKFLQSQGGSAALDERFTALLRRVGETIKCEAMVCSMFSSSHLQMNVQSWARAQSGDERSRA